MGQVLSLPSMAFSQKCDNCYLAFLDSCSQNMASEGLQCIMTEEHLKNTLISLHQTSSFSSAEFGECVPLQQMD